MYNQTCKQLATRHIYMRKDLSISEARNQLTSMPERLDREPATVAVTRNGKPVLAIMPWDLYESLEETIEIMSDPGLLRQVRKGIADLKAGRVADWSKVKRELGL